MNVHEATIEKMFERVVEVGHVLGEPIETFEELTLNYAVVNKKHIFLLDKHGASMVDYNTLPDNIKKMFLEEFVETIKIQD